MAEERTKTYMELWQENQDLKRELEMLKSKIVEYGPVKGRGELSIIKLNKQEWQVIERKRTSRDGTEIKETIKIVPHRNVVILWKIIKHLCPAIRDKTSYKKIAEILVKLHKLPYDAEAFNGGNHRSTYFLLYQYPAKILHQLKYVEYSLSGDFTRLKGE